MISRRSFLTTGSALAALAATSTLGGRAMAATFPVTYTDAEWHARLTENQYLVLRQNATERPFSSPLHEEMREGIYTCVGCDQYVYDSKTKYYSDSGWPAFYEEVAEGIERGPDPVYGEILPEVHCANCGSHMGHVFNDGPEPTGERHCINGLGLNFIPA
ncbi:peptide-methionine (R)-S-oxide reductase MsrB [Jannaschia helgolandensis]|uniref:peptide-methionine (R)-S-oxide reductase MsrB n=1 Tax=Jannaschia helgolandensis TaxID=188906 RepID=UPI0030D9D172|tara:strand:+ start:447 stop:926 length:480 start_codon:yes stop_codon:yes gene_type:complete